MDERSRASTNDLRTCDLKLHVRGPATLWRTIEDACHLSHVHTGGAAACEAEHPRPWMTGQIDVQSFGGHAVMTIHPSTALRIDQFLAAFAYVVHGARCRRHKQRLTRAGSVAAHLSRDFAGAPQHRSATSSIPERCPDKRRFNITVENIPETVKHPTTLRRDHHAGPPITAHSHQRSSLASEGRKTPFPPQLSTIHARLQCQVDVAR